MKKITLLSLFLCCLIGWQAQAQGDTCSEAIDLGLETSPYSGSTANAANDELTFCNNAGTEMPNASPDLYFSILVPNGSTLTMRQSSNGFDSAVKAFYGDCDNRTSVACFDDDDLTTVVFANTTGSDQMFYWVEDGYTFAASVNSGDFTLEWSVIACSNATVAYTVVSDCANGEQFLVNVNVSSLGSATSLTISDDQGSAPVSVTAAGDTVFGPFGNGTSVILTVTNDQDANCTLTSPIQTQAVCPPDCANATPISGCGEEVTAVIVAGNGAWNPGTCGFSTPGTEQVYTFTPTETGPYVLEVVSATGGYVDYFYKEASGTCDQTGWTCIDDNTGAGTDAIGTLTAGTTYLFLLDGEGITEKTHTFKIQCLPTCFNPTATYTVVSDCANGEQFNVDVTITDMGTGVNYTISDDQGSATQALTQLGTVTFGPFGNGTQVIFTISNDDDATCVLTSPAQSQAICPPDCANATPIAACGEEITADIVAGNGAWNPGTCGFSTPGTEVVYTFTPAETGAYVLEVVSATGGYVDYFYKEASGTCDQTGWTCIDDNTGPGTDPIGTLTAGTPYLFLLDGEGTTAKTHVFKIQCLPSCTNGTATYTVVSDCANGEQFNISVDVTSMGTATTVNVSDDQGSAPQVLTSTGTVVFGPFPNSTNVVITVANADDDTCVLTSSVLTQVACPPDNDSCSNAVAVVANGDFDSAAIIGTNISATNQAAIAIPTCDNNNFALNGKDVWYTVTVPASGTITVETKADEGSSLTDTGIQALSGTCDALTAIACSADEGEGNFSILNLTGLTPDATIYVRVWGYNGANGTFRFSAYDASLLGVGTVNEGSFRAYPNPVKDILNISYTQNITNVAVFNLLGQQVIAKSLNASQSQIDMSNLAAGTYIVKVTSDGKVKSLKIVKY